MSTAEDDLGLPAELGDAEVAALALDEPFLESDVRPGDAFSVPLDARTRVADWLNDARLAVPAQPAAMSRAEPAVRPTAGSADTLLLRAFDEPFSVPANAESLAASLELAYSVGGWALFDEVAAAAATSIEQLEGPRRSALEPVAVYTGQSIASLAGNYLLRLEEAAEQMLARVLDERVEYLAQVRTELIDTEGPAPRFRLEDDGAGGRRPVQRARMLLADLECVRLLDEEVGITRQQQGTAQALALALKAVKLKLDPFGGLLSQFASPPRWVEQLASLIGLSQADIEKELGEFRSRAAVAASLAAGVRTRLIQREPLMAAAVLQFGQPVPVDPAQAAQAVAAAVAAAAAATARLRERLQAGELSVRQRNKVAQVWTFPGPFVIGAGPPLLQDEGFFSPARRPEWVWANILDGGPLQAAAGAPSLFTLWDLGPLVTAADKALLATITDGRMQALTATCLREMRQQRLRASLKALGRDAAIGLLLASGSLLGGPMRPLFVAAEVLASFCSFAATAERFSLESEVQQSDWAGAGQTLQRLSDHAPETLALVLEGVNLVSNVLVAMPRLRQLQQLLDAGALATAAGQAGMMVLTMLAEEPEDSTEAGEGQSP